MVVGLLRAWLDQFAQNPRPEPPLVPEAIVWGKNDVLPLGKHPDDGFVLQSDHAPPAYLLFRNGLNLLIMEGTRWQMGYQHGRLLWNMRDVSGVPLHARFGPGRRPDFSERPAHQNARWPNVQEPWPEGDELPPVRFTRYVERILTEDIARDQLWLKKGAKKLVLQMYRTIWRTLAHNAPWNLLESYYGVADGAGVQREIADHSVSGPDALIILVKTLYGAHTFESLAESLGHPLGCTSFVSWGNATADGGLIHARNLDFFPLVGVFDRYPLVQVFRHIGEPGLSDTDRWRVSVTAAGVHDIGVTAINDAGIVSGLHQNFSTEVKAGWGFDNATAFELSTRIIESATTLDDVKQILTGGGSHPKARRPSGAWTYVVSDAKVDHGEKAVVVEVTHGQAALAQPCTSTTLSGTVGPRWSLVQSVVDQFSQAGALPVMAQSNLHMDTQQGVGKDDRLLINRTMALDVTCRYVRAVQVAAGEGPLTPVSAMRGLGDHTDPFTGSMRMLNRVIGNATTVASAVFLPRWSTAKKPDHRVWVAPNLAPSSNGPFVEIPVSILLDRTKSIPQILRKLPKRLVQTNPWEGIETTDDIRRMRILKEYYGEGYRRLLFGCAQPGVTERVIGPRPDTALEPRFLSERERIRAALPCFEEAVRQDRCEATYPLTVACLAIRAYGLGEGRDMLVRASAGLRAAWARCSGIETPYAKAPNVTSGHRDRPETQQNAVVMGTHEIRVLWLVEGWLADLCGRYLAARKAYRQVWISCDDTPTTVGQHPFMTANDHKLRAAARRYYVIPFRRTDAAELAYDPYLGDLMEYLPGQSFYLGRKEPRK